MKIKGTKVSKPARDVVVFPRTDGDIAFWVHGVESFDEFDVICPPPEAPTALVKGGETVVKDDDPTYLGQLRKHHELRLCWLILKSLDDPDNGIEWERVSIEQPRSWKLYEEELKEIGLVNMELRRLENKIWEVNALNEGAMDAARAAFLAGRPQKEG